MKKQLIIIKNISVTIAILLAGFGLCLVMQNVFEEHVLIPSIFMLGVFLISVITDGFVYGVIASVVSVLAVNYAFTFPYFRINFTIPENLLSAIIMIAMTLITCCLTSKIKHQEQIRLEGEREKMRANLLRAVSHDLRTPLTTIYGASSALLENGQDFTEEQKNQMLEGIKEDSQWLHRMVENLLSITRLDGENVTIIKTPTALDELLDSVLVKFSKRYADQEVEVDIPDELVMIPMDALLIEQVIVNILENTVQHAEGMDKIWLRAFTISDKVIFEIRDNGKGIPEDKLKTIFAEGIGLSVCATIIKAHGGDITAENSNSGGAVFRFTLDVEERESDEESI